MLVDGLDYGFVEGQEGVAFLSAGEAIVIVQGFIEEKRTLGLAEPEWSSGWSGQ